MSRKKTKRTERRRRSSNGTKRRYVFIGSGFLILIVALGSVAGPWRTPLSKTRIGSLFFSPPPPPESPTKEYIYAGGRLVATEEPNPAAPLTAPTNLIAATFSNAQIDVSWSAVPNAHHYRLERADVIGESNFQPINTNVVGTTYNDSTVTNGNAYIYRVKAADAANNLSPVSNIDVAVAITFEDDPFPAPPTFTLVRGQHILQLRTAINALRITAGMGQTTWTQTINPAQPGTVTVMAVDIEELRTKLDDALGVFNLPTGGYTDATLSNKQILKTHITELRSRVK